MVRNSESGLRRLNLLKRMESEGKLTAPTENYVPDYHTTSRVELTLDRMLKDPETGYLYAPQINGFTLEKKKKFVESLRECWPNMTKARREAGVNAETLRNHLRVDKRFAEDVEEIKLAVVDHVEGKVVEFASNPKNFMDRIAVLRAYRGELYNPVQKVQHVGAQLSPQDLERRRINLAKVVDAEVVKVSESILKTEAEDTLREAPGQNALGPIT